MSVEPAATASVKTTNDPALLVPTDVTSAPVTAAPVSVSEIAEFLRHLADLRTSGREGDPDARAAFLHRKTELFARLAADPALSATPSAPGRRGTP